jgi:6-pyruvoyltetrahydropterin/6-carboxytetrahydropterin synthase
MTINCTRRFEFDAGHRVTQHESKCRHVHGHRYTAEITIESIEGLDGVGRVIDFGRLKEVVGRWIDDKWDHAYIAHPEDWVPAALLEKESAARVYIMPKGMEPTAENLATHLAYRAQNLLVDDHLRVVRVVLWETPNCKAEWKI